MSDKKKITIKEVAHMCGVGIGTVSRAINNQPGVKDEVRRKILSHINDIGWKRNNIIDRMSNASNGKLVVFVASRTGMFARHTDNDIIDLLLEQCELEHYETLMLLNNRTEALKQCLRMKPYAVVQIGHLDGLLEQETELQKQGIRVINLAENEHYVGAMLHPDHFTAGREMVMALRRTGHRRIGFLGGFGSISRVTADKLPTLRLEKLVGGIVSAHPEFDLSKDCVSDNYGDDKYIRNALKQAAHTAWICDEQRSCALLLHTACALNIRIPDDISLITISPEKPSYMFPMDISRSFCNLSDRRKKVMELLKDKRFPEHEEITFPNGFHRGTSIRKIEGEK